MVKKESDNIDNNSTFHNKDIRNSHDCEHSRSFGRARISERLNECNTSYNVYTWDPKGDPYLMQIPIGPELQKLCIDSMSIFVGNLIFKTESGVVVMIKADPGFHQLLIPIRKPYREHAAILSKTALRLLNSHVFKSFLNERVIDR